MYNIINYSSKRMIRIIKLLFQNNGFYRTNDLCELIGVSNKTLIDDLKNLNKYISSISDLSLDFNKNDINITNFSYKSFTLIQSKILLDSLSVKFILELVNFPNEDINYYSEKLFTSVSSLYRRVSSINIFLEKYGLEIRNEFRLYFIDCESEYEYRRFVTNFLLEIYGNNVLAVMSEKHYDFFVERLDHMYESNLSSIKGYYVDYYSVFYYYSILREENGYSIDYSDIFLGNNVDFSNKEKNELLSLNINLNKNTLLSIESNIYISNYLLSSLKDDNKLSFITEFVELIYKDFDLIGFTKEKKYLIDIFSDIYIEVKYFKVPYPSLNNRFFFFTDKIKSNHALCYRKLKELLAYFEERMGVSFSIYEDYLIYLLVTTIPDILTIYFEEKMLVISHISVEHSLYLFSKIESELKICYIFIPDYICLDKSKLGEINFDDYSIIVSDFELPVEHAIVINELPSEEDIKNIKKRLLN